MRSGCPSFARLIPQRVFEDIGRDVASVIDLPIVWMLTVGPLVFELRRGHLTRQGSLPDKVIKLLLGVVIAYAPWGWQLWEQFGNPVYAWYDASCDPLRRM